MPELPQRVAGMPELPRSSASREAGGTSSAPSRWLLIAGGVGGLAMILLLVAAVRLGSRGPIADPALTASETDNEAPAPAPAVPDGGDPTAPAGPSSLAAADSPKPRDADRVPQTASSATALAQLQGTTTAPRPEATGPAIRNRGLKTEDAVPTGDSGEESRAAGSSYRRKVVVAIGVDKYGKDSRLKPLMNAENDAREFWELLQEDFGYKAEEGRYLTNEQATRAAIRDIFEKWIPEQRLGAEDSFLFFFAGHGLIADDNAGWLAASDSKTAMIPQTFLSIQWLRDTIEGLPCRHKLLILDSCYSGSLFQDRAQGVAQAVPAGPAPPAGEGPAGLRGNGRGGGGGGPDNFQVLLRQPVFFGMSAGRDTPVADGLGKDRHSVFTTQLLEVLRQRADTRRADQAFTFRTAAALIADRTTNALGSAQIPEYGRLGEGSGDFLFTPIVRRLTPREEARRTGYAQLLNKSQQEVASNNLAAAAEALDQCPEDLRGWEWRHLQRRVSPELAIFQLEEEKLVGIALDADRDRFVVSSDRGGFILWSTDGRLLDNLGTPVRTLAIAFHPSNRTLSFGALAEGGIGHSLVQDRIGKATAGINVGEPVTALAYTPDGKLLLCGTLNGNIEAWSIPQNKQVRVYAPHAGMVIRIRVTPDGSQFLTASHDHTARLYRLDRSAPAQKFLGHENWVTAAAVAPDGKSAITVSKDQTLQRFDLADGRLLETIQEPSAINDLEFSADGHLAATAGWDHRIRIYDTTNWKLQRVLAGHTGEVSRLATDRRNNHLYSASLDATARKWSWADGIGLEKQRIQEAEFAAIVARNRMLVTGAEDGTIRIRKNGTWTTIPAHDGGVWGVSLSDDGTQLASAGEDGAVRLWDVETGAKRRDLNGGGGRIKMPAFDPSGQYVCGGGLEGSLWIWETGSGKKVLSAKPDGSPVVGIGFCDAGNRVLRCSVDGALRLIDAKSGDETGTTQFGDAIYAFALSPSRKLVALGGRGGRVGVYETATLSRVWSTDRHIGAVQGVCFSRDEDRVFSAGTDQTIRAWDAAWGQELLSIPGEGAPIAALCVDTDDLWAATIRGDVLRWTSEAIAPAAAPSTPLIGESVLVRLVGAAGGTVWGSGPYTGDSSVPTAAVHAGLVKVGEEGVVRFVFIAPPRQFRGSRANGVQTLPYGPYPQAFRLEKVAKPYPANEKIVSVSEASAELRKKSNGGLQPYVPSAPPVPPVPSPTQRAGDGVTKFRVRLVGTLTGTVWGSGPYTGDSQITTAAVHAGLVRPGKQAIVVLEFVAPPARFSGSTKNGVTALPYDEWPKAFVLSRDDPAVANVVLNIEDIE